MRSRALLALTALLLWAAAWLLPERLGAGREFWLIDVSASMAGTEAPAAAQADPQRTYFFARDLTLMPATEAGQEESALGEALIELSQELGPGDTVHVFTDGRSTDVLPPRALFADCQIVSHAPPPGPRLHEVRAPPAWPEQGELAVDARLLDADLSRAEIAVESAPPGVELLRAVPAAPGWIRLELRARDPAHPPALLRIRWREGERSTARAVALAAPSSAPLVPVNPAHWSAQEADLVRAGGTVLLASAAWSDWMNVPAAFRPFQPAQDHRPLTILLDRSGSMEQGGLDEARALLHNWADAFPAGTGLRVQAFAAELEAPLDLRLAPERARLAALLPFGPTRLAEAVQKACAALPDDATLLIISDGRAEAPAEGWDRWRAAVVGERKILCVAVGTDFDLTTLSTIGEPITAGTLAERLGQAFDQVQEQTRGDAFAQPGASLPLPARWSPPEARPALEAAPGAELLMQDAGGRAVLALRRVGGGSALGLAGAPEAGWPEELRAAVLASRQPAGGWSEGRLSLVAGPPAPRVQQEDRMLDLVLLDAGPPARWEVRGADSRLPVAVGDAAGGRAWLQPPAADLEWSTEDAAWQAWLKEGVETRNRAGPRPTLLVAALVAASFVFFLAHRARA